MTTMSPLPDFTFSPESLPDALPTAVYIARDLGGAVLYVGMTGSLGARFAAHKRADLWWSAAVSIAVEMWPSRDAASAREDELIAEFDPPHNRAEKWWNRGAGERGGREEVLIEMYEQGAHLNVIAGAIGASYQACVNMVTDLRRQGRLGRRPKPPPRRWVRMPDGSFDPQPMAKKP